MASHADRLSEAGCHSASEAPGPTISRRCGGLRISTRRIICTGHGEADTSASLAFRDASYRGLHKIVLVAAAGEWWRFKIATREDYKFDLFTSDEEEEQREDNINKGRVKDKPKGNPSTQFRRYEDLL